MRKLIRLGVLALAAYGVKALYDRYVDQARQVAGRREELTTQVRDVAVRAKGSAAGVASHAAASARDVAGLAKRSAAEVANETKVTAATVGHDLAETAKAAASAAPADIDVTHPAPTPDGASEAA